MRSYPPGPPCCGARLSVHVIAMTFMSELPASDTLMLLFLVKVFCSPI